MLSIQIIGFQRWMLMMVTRLRCQQSAVVDILGILLSVDVFFAIGGYFFASGGYFLPGSAMDMFLLLMLVVDWMCSSRSKVNS